MHTIEMITMEKQVKRIKTLQPYVRITSFHTSEKYK